MAQAETVMAQAGGSDLTALVRAAHRDAARLLDIAGQEKGPADPRLTLHASDAAVAAWSAHLSVMERVVYPVAAGVVPRGRERAEGLRRTAREAALVMRGIEQYVQGDRYHPGRGPAELRVELVALARAHARAEDTLLRDLDERLGASELARLRGEFEHAMRRAPTRPHPHLGHRAGLVSRLAGRLAGHWDHLLDVLDAREVAGRPVRAPAPAGLWGWYLLGRPTDDQVAQSDDPAAQPAGRSL